MKRRAILLVVVLTSAVLLVQTAAGQTLSTSEAKNHIGEQATVCGQVASSHFAARSRGNPTFINLDQPYPNQVFTILIWGSDRPKFGSPETAYQGKHLCVRGVIQLYRGVPEVVAREASQITVQ